MQNKEIKILILLMICTLCACESNPPSKDIESHIMGLTIVQLSSKEYLDYVVADRIYFGVDSFNDGNYYKIRGVGECYYEYYQGQSPYISLSNDYYLIDWKWGFFLYQPTNVLLNIKWQDVTDRQQMWDLNTTIISRDFISYWSNTDRKEIDKYLNITPAPNDSFWLRISTDHVRPIFLNKDNLKEIMRQDSLQQIYIERLNRIIQEGALEKVAPTVYKAK